MLFYIPLQFLFIFIWLCTCNDYQELIEELFVRDKDEEIDFEKRLEQIGKAKVFYSLLAYLLFSIGFAILITVRFALIGI